MIPFLPLLETLVPFFIKMFVSNQAKKEESLQNFRRWVDSLKQQGGRSETLRDSYNAQKEELSKPVAPPTPQSSPQDITQVGKPVDTINVASAESIAALGPDWPDWCRRAIDISKEFEGGNWANITGNFDGAYLTCGALGFTWKYNNQPPMILEFDKRNSGLGKKLMPQFWEIYLKAAVAGENAGASIVEAWSNGSANVRAEIKKELEALWSSEQMIAIQVETAWKMMGIFAKKQCLEMQSFFKLAEPRFEHFAYFFDQAVLNGQGSTVAPDSVGNTDAKDILNWCKSASGYQLKDLAKNADVWAEQLSLRKQREPAVTLWKMAYARAMMSRNEFKPVTMNRRGTLALGIGYVNGELRKYDWHA